MIVDAGRAALRLRVSRDEMAQVDQSLRYQQSLRSGGIGVVVLKARTNRLADLLPLVTDLRELLVRVRPGELHEVRWRG